MVTVSNEAEWRSLKQWKYGVTAAHPLTASGSKVEVFLARTKPALTFVLEVCGR